MNEMLPVPARVQSDLVRKYFSAYEAKDRKAIEALLSGDFTFTSPLDDRIDRAAYFKRCWPNSEKVRVFRVEALAVQGGEAFVRYECEHTNGVRFRNTEVFRFEGDKIKAVDVYFGRDTGTVKKVAPAEAEVRALIEDRAQSVRAMDARGATSSVAPDVLIYDVVGPLRRNGSEASRQRAEEWFATFQGPAIGYEIRDLAVAAGDDVAFCHSLNHVNAARADGNKLDMWWRSTVCLRKVGGAWKVAHEHNSVPFDPATGKPSLGLKP